jgi:threonine aldolase
MTLSRRQFLSSSLPFAAFGAASLPAAALAQAGAPDPDTIVSLAGDAAPQTPLASLQQLQKLLQKYPQPGDQYGNGGAVAELEKKFSAMLGKEDTVFMPTGTLANQLAIRLLCGESRHALVQQESHVYRDESDAVPLLSHINAVPMAPGRAAPTVAELREAIERAENGPYPIRVGAIALESPVRRASGATIAPALLAELAQLARAKNIPMHLDGARLLFMCGTPGFELAAYCAHFDTVYVSLYKYLGAPYGGILSGTKAMMARAREMRHVFGGTQFRAWQAALPALDALDGAEQRYAAVHAAGERLLAALEKLPGFAVRRIDHASNIATLEIPTARAASLAARLKDAGILVRKPAEGRVDLYFNETLLRRDTAAIAAAFSAA